MGFIGEGCGKKHGGGEKPTARRIINIKACMSTR